MKQEYFENVNTQIRFPEVESQILDIWAKEETFKRSLEKTAKNQAFVFYDGPPFATGLPHYGHLLAGTLKDIIPRYWTMRGYNVDRRFGWDCHGLPVENEMEKEFKISSGKRDIEKLGIHVFNEACRSIVLRYTNQWEKVVNRMGRWVDFVNQYRTMDPSYMESIWWVFRQMWDKGLIYQGFRVQPYCPRCATPLSNFEVNEGYKDKSGPSITVAFPLADDPNVKFLVWTTTPWTLPSNVALAVGADIIYVKIKVGDDIYILAKDRLGAYYKDISAVEILAEVKGSELAGLRYTPMFDYFKDRNQGFFTVTTADFVSTEDGAGIVHIAPAFGEDDFQAGQKLGLPIVCPVDDEGKFTDEVPEWQGQVVYAADDEIIKTIKKAGRLFSKATVEHRYPHCYRCDRPLIYKAITTWFMKIEPLKKNMFDNNQQIHWVPQHLQNGRFGKGIESAPDWNISRNRYWGTPIPVWICECGHKDCAGGLNDLHKLAGNGDASVGEHLHAQAASKVKKSLKTEEVAKKLMDAGIDKSWAETLKNADISPVDIHSHIVDELEIKCPKCGGVMRRTSEVLDCWFESGSMPYAQMHYPFDNKEKFEKNFPADFIAEGLDQTRGWFYTLTVLASALFERSAFKNVIVNGIILAADGKKLSKRLKNYAPPEVVLNELGADSLRLFLINSPAVKADDLRFSEEGVREMSRAILLPFWNAYSFFVTYANVDKWKPSGESLPDGGAELDKWIVSLLNDIIASVNKEMERYNLYKVVPLLVDFIDNLTNWYIRRSRRRFWKSENDSDKDVAYGTLYYVLVQFSKVMAPFLPFLTEAIYRNLVVGKIDGAAGSVHLAAYPGAVEGIINEKLDLKMRLVRQAVTMGRAMRSRFTIKTRQPLSEFMIIIADKTKLDLIMDMEALIKDELNVKKVVFDCHEERVVSVSAKPNFKKLGKVFGPRMKEASGIIEKFTALDIKNLESGAMIDVLGTALTYEDIEIRRTKHEGVEVQTEGELTVGLETTITPELRNECVAREFINRVQNQRKTSGLNVTDRIIIHCKCPPELELALREFREYICAETLTVDIRFFSDIKDENNAAGFCEKWTEAQCVDLEGVEALICVEKTEGLAS
ncbi:MAG: isoleucine--tRNA ligase [Chitinispirillales bacterium]|jgi:isoleucyl-tRNA synthetase|nr:isoleucine--tRNA ligase [Chitinispirillales bacterium]